MELDPLLLSRLQFAFVVSFHAIFPVFTIGLASYIAVLHALFYKTANPAWDRLAQLWTKVFAVAFGMGVVSGIVMSFQFGTNWSNFSQSTANFMGPLLSYEVVTAFFLEAAFLGVLLFGRGRVPQGVHLFAAIMVAIGTFISTFWILSANSWMHTPAGVEVINGVFRVTSWTEAIFNPSFPYRLAHMAMASFITGGFVVAGVSAWYLLIGRDVEANRKALSMCLWMLLVLTPTQALVGDFHGLNTLEYQPTKLAAMEGNWETREGAPFLLFAWPDQAAQQNRFEIGIPYAASLILTHELHGEVPGILEAPPEEQPPVALVFWTFRLMVGLGFLMIAVSLVGLYLRRGGRIYHSRRFLQTLRLMSVTPFIAVLAGWITTESGRAPWLVYGMMTHAEGVTPSLTGGMALFTLLGYVAVYGVIFYAGTYYLTRVIRYGMQQKEEEKLVDDFETPKRPWSATSTPFDDDPTKAEG
ncbi:cytochrome ubiquinol oxidase subunit I [Halomonas chromatireducens]|uniref:Cytochrome bd ubiquinol oxidase subunit 1 n=1 Tax=Halomonas chromatireducens TaxID=507626 RepID=A0A0X8HCH1_9GAMM|nr:cytochrome ubiquinol oxidase subunit I [Halomonas chromatireducens]AMD00123.1 Cytochrome bd ubiquinol oxidase subunit 1 [Halomonas chromatireducens]